MLLLLIKRKLIKNKVTLKVKKNILLIAFFDLNYFFIT